MRYGRTCHFQRKLSVKRAQTQNGAYYMVPSRRFLSCQCRETNGKLHFAGCVTKLCDPAGPPGRVETLGSMIRLQIAVSSPTLSYGFPTSWRLPLPTAPAQARKRWQIKVADAGYCGTLQRISSCFRSQVPHAFSIFIILKHACKQKIDTFSDSTK